MRRGQRCSVSVRWGGCAGDTNSPLARGPARNCQCWRLTSSCWRRVSTRSLCCGVRLCSAASGRRCWQPSNSVCRHTRRRPRALAAATARRPCEKARCLVPLGRRHIRLLTVGSDMPLATTLRRCRLKVQARHIRRGTAAGSAPADRLRGVSGCFARRLLQCSTSWTLACACSVSGASARRSDNYWLVGRDRCSGKVRSRSPRATPGDLGVRALWHWRRRSRRARRG